MYPDCSASLPNVPLASFTLNLNFEPRNHFQKKLFLSLMDRLMVNRLIQIDYNTGGTASSGTEDGELLCRNTWVTVWAAEK
jgi:hypothetical protein